MLDFLIKLVKFLVDESNLYASRNGREFHTNEQKMRAFLGINYIMSINKLPTTENHWEFGQFVDKEGIKCYTRSRFEDILRNLHFSDKTKDDKSDKGYKVESLSNSVSNDNFQSILKHMVESTGQSIMKHYAKNN